MVDDGIYTKNADIQARAGVDANTTSKATAATDIYVLNIEAKINAATRFNWSDVFGTLNADVAGVLTDTGACLCAINVISSDMAGYPSISEAESMITILRDTALLNISFLKKVKHKDFINKA